MAKKQFTVEINHHYCKACNICVKFCPVNILELRYQVLYVNDQEKCIGCRTCELRCPDYAIEVFEKEAEE